MQNKERVPTDKSGKQNSFTLDYVTKDSKTQDQTFLKLVNEMIYTQQTYVDNLRNLHNFLTQNKAAFREAFKKDTEKNFATDYINAIEEALVANAGVANSILSAFVDPKQINETGPDGRKLYQKSAPDAERLVQSVSQMHIKEIMQAINNLKLNKDATAKEPAVAKLNALLLNNDPKYSVKINDDKIEIIDRDLPNVRYLTILPSQQKLNITPHDVAIRYIIPNIMKEISKDKLITMQQAISQSITSNVRPIIGHGVIFPSNPGRSAQKRAEVLDLLWQNQFKGSTLESFSSHSITSAQRGPRFKLFLQEIEKTLEPNSSKTIEALVTKNVINDVMGTNEATKNEEQRSKNDTITIKNVISKNTNAEKFLKDTLQAYIHRNGPQRNVVLEKDPKNPERYTIFAATRDGSKRSELKLAEITFKKGDLVIGLKRNQNMQWTQSKDFAISFISEATNNSTGNNIKISSKNPKVANELFASSVKKGIFDISFTKKTPRESTVLIPFDDNLDKVMANIQTVLSAGLTPKFSEDDKENAKIIANLRSDNKSHYLYLPPQGKDKAGEDIRKQQKYLLDALQLNKSLTYSLARDNNKPSSMIQQLVKILENGDMPDAILFSSKQRQIIKDYIRGHRYSKIKDWIQVNINTTDPVIMRKQIDFALEFGLIPHIKNPDVILDRSALDRIPINTVTIPPNRRAICIEQSKALIAAGYRINADDKTKNKILKTLHSQKNKEHTVIIHSINGSETLKRFEEAKNLGFSPKLDDATQKSVLEQQNSKRKDLTTKLTDILQNYITNFLHIHDKSLRKLPPQIYNDLKNMPLSQHPFAQIHTLRTHLFDNKDIVRKGNLESYLLMMDQLDQLEKAGKNQERTLKGIPSNELEDKISKFVEHHRLIFKNLLKDCIKDKPAATAIDNVLKALRDLQFSPDKNSFEVRAKRFQTELNHFKAAIKPGAIKSQTISDQLNKDCDEIFKSFKNTFMLPSQLHVASPAKPVQQKEPKPPTKPPSSRPKF